jgi:hypothetical protein
MDKKKINSKTQLERTVTYLIHIPWIRWPPSRKPHGIGSVPSFPFSDCGERIKHTLVIKRGGTRMSHVCRMPRSVYEKAACNFFLRWPFVTRCDKFSYPNLYIVELLWQSILPSIFYLVTYLLLKTCCGHEKYMQYSTLKVKWQSINIRRQCPVLLLSDTGINYFLRRVFSSEVSKFVFINLAIFIIFTTTINIVNRQT